ncbi:MAG: hypothetical protein LBQ54_01195 [Planctomycetaceae bacterium]|nr:hypothetical protein [Planctomycetaceae bacterium]
MRMLAANRGNTLCHRSREAPAGGRLPHLWRWPLSDGSSFRRKEKTNK